MSRPRQERAADAALAFALEVPALLLLFSDSPLAPVGGVLALIAIAGARLGRFDLPAPIVQAAIQLVCLTGALTLLTTVGESTNPRFGAYVTLGGLAVALPALWWRADRRGSAIALGAGLLALMGLARTVERPVFGLGVGAYLAAAIVATLLRDGGWPAFFRHRRGALAPLLVGLGLAGGVLGGLGWALPEAEPAVSRALHPYLFGGPGASGFGEGRMTLGESGRITLDNGVKLRVEGDVDHLRGRVYVDYRRGSWSVRGISSYEPPAFEPGSTLPLAEGPPPRDARPVTIEGSPDSGLALFAPLGSSRLDDAPPATRRDPYGILELPPEMVTEPRTWTFLTGPPERRLTPAPGRADTGLPRAHAQRFRDVAEQWTAGHTTPRARLEAITSRFAREFTYSLDLVEPPQKVDPTLWFLTFSRSGHCEYFASGLVLMARALDIPARVVAGYRVIERNAVGGYAVVRGRDAHAWAEVWLDGKWETWDPTPPGALGENERQTLTGLEARWDQFKRAFGRAFERLADLSAAELTVALAVISALLLAWLRVRRQRDEVLDGPDGFPPLERLEAHLDRRHRLGRSPNETLAQYGARLQAAGLAGAATLVQAVSGLRYGGRGDAGDLAGQIDAWIAGDRSRRRPAGGARGISSS